MTTKNSSSHRHGRHRPNTLGLSGNKAALGNHWQNTAGGHGAIDVFRSVFQTENSYDL